LSCNKNQYKLRKVELILYGHSKNNLLPRRQKPACSVNQFKVDSRTGRLQDYPRHAFLKAMSVFFLQNAFDDYFPEVANIEGTLWRGLLYTVIGLGALATMAAVR